MPRGYQASCKLFGALCVTAVAAGSCGGRTLSDSIWSEPGGDAGAGRSGTGDTGSGRGGRGGGAAGSRGQTGGAGGSGAAGAPQCGKVACPDIGCGPGFMSILLAADCCPTCVPIPCGGCPVISCASGSHLEQAPGMCCPTCVKDPPDACKNGQAAYSTFRMQLIEKYNSIGCKTPMDCAIVYETNRCVSGCGIALPVSVADSAQQNLRASADNNCSSCPPVPTPQCPAASVSCVQGTCSLGGTLPK